MGIGAVEAIGCSDGLGSRRGVCFVGTFRFAHQCLRGLKCFGRWGKSCRLYDTGASQCGGCYEGLCFCVRIVFIVRITEMKPVV